MIGIEISSLKWVTNVTGGIAGIALVAEIQRTFSAMTLRLPKRFISIEHAVTVGEIYVDRRYRIYNRGV